MKMVAATRSLIVTRWRLIGKCLRPLPNKWRGLTDPEARVRTRYVDLAINTEARDLITARSRILHAIRETLVGKGFLNFVEKRAKPRTPRTGIAQAAKQ